MNINTSRHSEMLFRRKAGSALIKGEGKTSENTADNKTEKKESKDTLEISLDAYKAGSKPSARLDREARSQMKYEMLAKKSAMKLDAARVISGGAGDSKKSEGDIVKDTCRAMKAAADATAGRPVSREDMQLLLKLDPDLYFLVMISAKNPDIVDEKSEEENAEATSETTSEEASAETSEAACVEAGTEVSADAGIAVSAQTA